MNKKEKKENGFIKWASNNPIMFTMIILSACGVAKAIISKVVPDQQVIKYVSIHK